MENKNAWLMISSTNQAVVRNGVGGGNDASYLSRHSILAWIGNAQNPESGTCKSPQATRWSIAIRASIFTI
jgi:hypothetical protein